MLDVAQQTKRGRSITKQPEIRLGEENMTHIRTEDFKRDLSRGLGELVTKLVIDGLYVVLVPPLPTQKHAGISHSSNRNTRRSPKGWLSSAGCPGGGYKTGDP